LLGENEAERSRVNSVRAFELKGERRPGARGRASPRE